ncbi:uncharacterized protein F5Z01DRAFT_640633 [Emericellopsis atlantica]|uniref:Uncharacterized protein n=1 Tax=Emericellopsis atlantica TaxID=2614577 RepID=A0A9P7ZE92_9HYPO|nr:uncharacterized protein F5Z01DRAFT_640633 [Emericellopsis atlantica]KAG9250052.1 hypothetical protein F5Z01DRAFT_640633 [Emericellopsis atlantica]
MVASSHELSLNPKNKVYMTVAWARSLRYLPTDGPDGLYSLGNKIFVVVVVVFCPRIVAIALSCSLRSFISSQSECRRLAADRLGWQLLALLSRPKTSVSPELSSIAETDDATQQPAFKSPRPNSKNADQERDAHREPQRQLPTCAIPRRNAPQLNRDTEYSDARFLPCCVDTNERRKDEQEWPAL